MDQDVVLHEIHPSLEDPTRYSTDINTAVSSHGFLGRIITFLYHLRRGAHQIASADTPLAPRALGVETLAF